jgi:hypothetical protein
MLVSREHLQRMARYITGTDAPGNIRANFLEFFCHEPLTKSRTPFILSGFQRLGP